MKEHPILFTGPMVNAILDGRKTQTRRIVKPQPNKNHSIAWFSGGSAHNTSNNGQFEIVTFFAKHVQSTNCPYGSPGDRLWVRETWKWSEGGGSGWRYRADGELKRPGKWKPSIHMPRIASRITLEIDSVKAERLQDITEADAIAEGIFLNDCEVWHWKNGSGIGGKSAVDAFRLLFESINGADSWNSNPWVWGIEFKKVQPC